MDNNTEPANDPTGEPSQGTKRIEVPFMQFIGEMNGVPTVQGMWDYRVFAGIEECDEAGHFGLVVKVNYEVVKDGAPPCPESFLECSEVGIKTNPAHWQWKEQWLEMREANFHVGPPVGTPVFQKQLVGNS